jgi:DNA-binding NtrC family response regulator
VQPWPGAVAELIEVLAVAAKATPRRTAGAELPQDHVEQDREEDRSEKGEHNHAETAHGAYDLGS